MISVFTVRGTDYVPMKIGGPRLWHVVRRLAPAITAVTNLVPLLAVAREISARSGGLDLEAKSVEDVAEIFSALRPAAVELQRMSDEDVDYVIKACCEHAQRRNKVGEGFSRVVLNGVYNDRDDEDMVVSLAICWHVLIFNVKDVIAYVGASAGKPGGD